MDWIQTLLNVLCQGIFLLIVVLVATFLKKMIKKLNDKIKK